MIYLEMRLGKEIAEAVDKDNMVVFETTNQLYALFKLKDEEGAVADFGNGLYMVTAKDYERKKKEQ